MTCHRNREGGVVKMDTQSGGTRGLDLTEQNRLLPH